MDGCLGIVRVLRIREPAFHIRLHQLDGTLFGFKRAEPGPRHRVLPGDRGLRVFERGELFAYGVGIAVAYRLFQLPDFIYQVQGLAAAFEFKDIRPRAVHGRGLAGASRFDLPRFRIAGVGNIAGVVNRVGRRSRIGPGKNVLVAVLCVGGAHKIVDDRIQLLRESQRFFRAVRSDRGYCRRVSLAQKVGNVA